MKLFITSFTNNDERNGVFISSVFTRPFYSVDPYLHTSKVTRQTTDEWWTFHSSLGLIDSKDRRLIALLWLEQHPSYETRLMLAQKEYYLCWNEEGRYLMIPLRLKVGEGILPHFGIRTDRYHGYPSVKLPYEIYTELKQVFGRLVHGFWYYKYEDMPSKNYVLQFKE